MHALLDALGVVWLFFLDLVVGLISIGLIAAWCWLMGFVLWSVIVGLWLSLKKGF